jgi:hypothetical protein
VRALKNLAEDGLVVEERLMASRALPSSLYTCRTAGRRRIDGSPIEAGYLNTALDYLAWAERYVEQLDPLSSFPRIEDFERPTNEYGNDDEKWKKGVARLLGAPWKDAWKIGKDYVAPRRKDPDDYWSSYRDKSVFEAGSAATNDEEDD